jgi:hypothetical protein
VIDPTDVARRRLMVLVWAYLLLLVLEGVLRKWVLPQWSDALLIVRDPIAIALVALGARDGYLPAIPLVRSLGWLCVAFLIVAAAQLMIEGVPPIVLAYGLRTYFLHPAAIFVIASVLRGDDLRRLAMAVLAVGPPIAILMVLQFRAAPTDWLNAGAGEGRLQITAALGRIRPAGPFSFISGPVFYFALLFAVLIASHVNRSRISPALHAAGWAALLVAAAVSGSRSLLVSLVPVLVACGIVIVRRPSVVGSFVRASVMGAAVVGVLWGSTAVQEGFDVLDARVSESGGTGELLSRSSDSYASAVWALNEAPLLGQGLGLGTNAGNALVGHAFFRFGESEWSRILFEAGPLFGAAYLGWRLWLTVWLLRHAARAAAFGQALPIAAAAAMLANLVAGPWGQPTTQGFAVFGAGMALAACRVTAANLEAARRRAPRVGVRGHDPLLQPRAGIA